MASKRAQALTAAVVQDVAGRDLPMKKHTRDNETPTSGDIEPTRDNMIAFRVRIPPADLATLKAIATQEGTTAGALIRRAIKELMRRQGAGIR